MTEQVLIVMIGGEQAALDMEPIQSLIELGKITAVPRAPAHCRGLAALRSQTLTVIDPLLALGIPRDETEEEDDAAESYEPKRDMALIIKDKGCLFALSVDEVKGVAIREGELQPVGAPLRYGWGDVALGEVETDQGTLLLLDPGPMISGEQATKT